MMRLSRSSHCAFSLIEIMCVVAIAGILLSAIFGVANTTIRAIRETRESIRQVRVRVGISRLMRRDFECAFRVRGKDIVTLKGGREVSGDGVELLQFFTTNTLARRGRVPETGLSRVTYSLWPSARFGDRVALVRSEQPYDVGQGLSGTAVSETLADGLVDCKIMFYTGSEWRDDWKMQTLPPGMRIQLAFEVEDNVAMCGVPSYIAPIVDQDADPVPAR